MASDKTFSRKVFEWVATIFIALALAFIIKTFIGDLVVVDGQSMYPTLNTNDKLIISIINYSFKDPEYGDIITLYRDTNTEYIKRVIGKPGDTIEIKDSIVYRNGIVLSEPYINPEPYNDFSAVVVPENCYFVMGDNRANSVDSRFQSLGFVQREDIIGKAQFRVYPFDQMGSLYK